jgi:hypothetical protein
MVNVTASIQTYGSGVSEMDGEGVLDTPPLVHPVNGISGSSRGVSRVKITEKFVGGVLESHTCRAVSTDVQQSMGLRGPWLRRKRLRKQLPAGLPHLLVPVCMRKSKGTRLV